MFRFTTSAVAANPTALATGRTPIPPRNFTSVSSAMADSANSATTNGTRTKAFFMVRLLLLGWILQGEGDTSLPALLEGSQGGEGTSCDHTADRKTRGK